ncbi:hypothetical protein [Thermoplasma volcanium GSS1]|uniref:3-dehydroquinate dehydratase n=1 Tax=Thermoplasma volcanium (strain ATCC 51530 / DSM 4299 / JCM 9571 / NBRC 15438 / GSS1) TaxID=273116 RepID=AROD_THEVO|nr:type I 3-dehydroquinate dehydratase [Thermoplasma volcanium]Q97CA8.1 RecName: Full=3-dehydroquinate dehydratase; Short=3-dehydroquinase; AltName: Full=Type I DHQase; AltName: Full=Type I dehydroquinase; Short=DHQ1 [Thermoplasma volcanium GSS1]BAB59336.1 hypothetical protein [Thermoplasma volcanium GSS1]
MPIIKSSRVNIGRFTIGGSIPIVIISIFDHDAKSLTEKFETKKLSDKNLYEIRFDLFDKVNIDEELEIIRALDEMDIDYIFTYRGHDPEKIYETAITKMVPAVDMDLSLLNKVNRRSPDTRIMVSYHTDSSKDMIEKLDEMLKANADIVKVACNYKDEKNFFKDLIEIAQRKEISGKPVLFIPMGKSFLRVISAYYVSDMVYAKYDKETAMGQPDPDYYNKAFSLFNYIG